MSADAVSYEQASKEIYDWLEYKQIDAADIEAQKDSIDKLINAMVSGRLTMDENHRLKYNLKFSIDNEDGEPVVKELSFKPRVSYKELSARTKAIKASDLEGRVMTYISVLTGKPVGILGNLDTVDMAICQSIVGFFTV